MENEKNAIIDEELFYNSARATYGVCSKHLKTQKNIFMSFSPHSTNQKMSFTNTIMIPFIKTEPSIDTRKDITRIKTESSKDEKYNLSIEKPITKIFIENENDKIDENTDDEIDLKFIEFEEKKESLEKNPYFFGGKISFDISKFQNNNEIENQKVKKIPNKNRKQSINDDINFYLKTCKDMNQKFNIASSQSNSNNKVKRMNSLNLKKLRNNAIPGKEGIEKKIRKNAKKTKTHFKIENKIKIKNSDNKNIKMKSDKNINKSFKISTNRIQRENTFQSDSSSLKNKDNDINYYKASLFNKNSSRNLKFNTENNLDIKNKNTKFKYKGVSHNVLKTGYNIETKEENKLIKKNEEKKVIVENEPKEKEKIINNILNKNLFNKSSNSRFLNTTRVKKYKSLTKEFIISEKKKTQNIVRKKMSETRRNLNFELELKNKDNLAKTQFNLFSPDKFTNTQFCGSDYLEYTLDCMELILKSDKAKKQVKNKVNFNFPKTKGKQSKKKIALFDVDETLVHCTGEIDISKETYQHCIEIVLPGNKRKKVGINIRPLWKKTLNLVKKNYHIVAFTASHQAYADAVLDFMDPTNKYFKYRLYRNNCSLVDVEGNKFYVKDLDIFDESYDLKDIIIVDNSVLSFIYHLENGIPIVPYYHEDKDGSLYVVGLYLDHIYKENDLREANKKYINLESFLNEAKLRKDSESIIDEASINNEGNKNETTDLENDISDSKEKPVVGEKNLNTVEQKKKSICSQKGQSRNSGSLEISTKSLKNISKLIDMYYEINNKRYIFDKKTEEIIEEKSNKSFSIDDEKEIKQNKSDKNLVDLVCERRLLTLENIPIRKNSRTKSNKTLHHYLNTKLIRSNFYDHFSDKVLLKK